MNTRTTQRLAAAGMAGAAGLAIAGFTALGSIFDYPKILEEPTAEILTLFRENQGAISAWFLVLAISAGLLAPVGLLLGRLAGGKLGRWIAGIGVAAATVQVIGLSRWVLVIPRRQRRRAGAVAPGRRPPHLRAPPHLARQGPRRDGRLRPDRDLHRARRHRHHPRRCPAMDGLPRLHLGRPHRHRRLHPPRPQLPEHHQLRRLRRMVPLAHRHGHHPLANQRGARRDIVRSASNCTDRVTAAS